MACTYNDDRQFRPHENVVISFNTIGNNSIAHHIPTPKRTPLRKHFAETVDKGEDIATPTIDGYTISDEKYVEARSTRISCNGVLTAVGSMYASHLDAHPLCTKSLTAGSLAVVGDVLAQLIEFGSDLRDSDIMFDRRRIFAMFVEGTFVSGPMLHFVFEFYEYIIPIHCQCEHNDVNLLDNDISEFSGDIDTGAQTDLDYEVSKRQYLAAFLHVAFDQVVMAFPYVAGMMIVTSLIEGHGEKYDSIAVCGVFNHVKLSFILKTHPHYCIRRFG